MVVAELFGFEIGQPVLKKLLSFPVEVEEWVVCKLIGHSPVITESIRASFSAD